MIRAAVWLASGRLHSWVSKAFSTRLPSGVFSNWKRRPHFEQCPEITMPLASLFTTYILGLSAMPTVSHSPETIASPVEIQTAPLPAKENPAADCNFKLSFQRTGAGTADCDLGTATNHLGVAWRSTLCGHATEATN